MALQVFAIERIASLATQARKRLDRLGLENALIHHGDGLLGWPEFAPFDAIIMAACPETVPQVLFDQLAEGGRLIAPVGLGKNQRLILFVRRENGIEETALDAAFFVPALAGLG